MAKEDKSLMNIQEKMRAMAKTQAESIKSDSHFMSVKNKLFSMGGITIGPTINVAIVLGIKENSFYDRQYDPNNTTPPGCFAIEDAEGNMIPHESSPNKQAESCEECYLNEFGSAVIGRGKACKNTYKLALVAYSDNDLIDENEIAVLSLPPTSIKNYTSYVRQITSQMDLPTMAVVTSLSFDMTQQHPVVQFKFVKTIDDQENLAKLIGIYDKANETLHEPYDVTSYDPKGADAIPQRPAEGEKKPAYKSKMS